MANEKITIQILAEEEPDELKQLSETIFNKFELNQSCTVKGRLLNPRTKEVEDKGEVVLRLLLELDTNAYTYIPSGDKRRRRKGVRPTNCIGGYKAQKMFKWKKDIRDNIPHYIIWRLQ